MPKMNKRKIIGGGGGRKRAARTQFIFNSILKVDFFILCEKIMSIIKIKLVKIG